MKYEYETTMEIRPMDNPKPTDNRDWDLHLFCVSQGTAYYVWRRETAARPPVRSL